MKEASEERGSKNNEMEKMLLYVVPSRSEATGLQSGSTLSRKALRQLPSTTSLAAVLQRNSVPVSIWIFSLRTSLL